MSGTEREGAVRYRAEGGVAHLTFDRPAARNAMTWRMYEELAEGLARIEADPAIRVAVLRGAGGKAFVAGTDIEQFVGFTGADGVAYETRIDAYVEALERVRVPTLAVVEGLAVGGGLAIANACDLRVATPGARFGVPIARTLGNCLSPANLRRLTATLGLPVVKRMLLLAEMPEAETLAPLGYLAGIAPAEALDATVAQMCDRLLGHAPVTMRVTREMLNALALDPEADGSAGIRACYGSRDFQEGVAAFLGKRPAAWSGT
ncbi:enoyl-CoA hydratase [Methylobacterium symbioticum]|uniref:Short-chain-enoyl-CoA hydratase n=1 Tax=Methylobacterium symbioticum TaxID=2584084 RepID=A0A509ECH9_9HYPH|nr:enoyl-CoA hydratase [Methylobacterium symbioticum]VUD71215.1 Short-chain-enoyl-CoA hydratase [Methylobacterium symbioticum]